MLSLLKTLFRRSGGNVALMFALAAPALLGIVGLAVDFIMISKKHSQLQAIADAAAVGSAHELPLANSNEALVSAVATEYVNSNLGIATPKAPPAGAARMMSATSSSGGGGSAAGGSGGRAIETDVKVVDGFTGVQVTIKETWTPFFAQFLTDTATPIVVKAKANILGEGLICVVGLMPRSDRAGIHMDNNSKIDAKDCGIYSNSSNRYAIRLDSHASIEARLICSVGGYGSFGWGTSISPRPLQDCPPVDDPLASRAAPTFGGCDHNGLEIGEGVEIPPKSNSDRELVTGLRKWFSRYSRNNPTPTAPSYLPETSFSNVTLVPGVYCGGLFIGQNQNVTLMPGVYVIKDGPFVVSGNAKIKGEGVGFYMTGQDSVFDFQADTSIDLVAPKTGPLAGLLMFEDRNVPHGTSFNPFNLSNLPDDIRLHRIRSNNARQLLGTVYLPHSILMIDADAPVADHSAYTAIIAWRVWLRDGPSLKLNADYKSTDVPVPSSLIGGQIVLAE